MQKVHMFCRAKRKDWYMKIMCIWCQDLKFHDWYIQVEHKNFSAGKMQRWKLAGSAYSMLILTSTLRIECLHKPVDKYMI